MSDNDKQTPDEINVTESLPSMSDETRNSTKKWAAVGIFAFGALLLIDDQVKKLKRRKDVTITVEEKPNQD